MKQTKANACALKPGWAEALGATRPKQPRECDDKPRARAETLEAKDSAASKAKRNAPRGFFGAALDLDGQPVPELFR